jgi:hypothetical protein
MKKIILFLVAIFFSMAVDAQVQQPNGKPNVQQNIDKPKPKKKYRNNFIWCFDVNAQYGILTQDIAISDISANYLNALNSNIGNCKFTNGFSSAIEGQVGFFFNHKKTLGIGLGFNYTQQKGDLILNEFSIEYQSKDFQGKPFRQKISANQPITESLEIINTNIPFVLKYKTKFSKHFGFKADLGIIYNLELRSTYTTNASFDYEAIYQYKKNSNGTYSAVYDNSPTPTNDNEWYITKNQYNQSNATGISKSFDSLQKQGYNVGLGVIPNKNSGVVSYPNGSIGFLIRPQFSYYLSRKMTLDIGGCLMYQSFKNSVNSKYRLTDKIGDYNSVLNTVATASFISYGCNMGVSYYFGKPAYLKRYVNKK